MIIRAAWLSIIVINNIPVDDPITKCFIDLLLLMFKSFIYGNKCIGRSNVLIRYTCVFAESEKNFDLWIMSFEIKLASPYCNKVF